MTDAEPPIVAVCCQGAGAVWLHSLVDGTELGQIPVGEHPVHATVVDGKVFVATMGERSVTVIDADGAVRRVELGVLGPSHFATAGGLLWVTCTAGDVVAAIDPGRVELVDRVPVGAEPHELAAHGGMVYAGSRRAGTVTVIDADDREPVGEVRFGEDARIEGVATAAAPQRGFAVDRRGARVFAFSLGSNPTQLARASIGNDPYDLRVIDDALLVPARGAGVVHEFDLALRERTVHEGFDRPVDVCERNGDRWVIDRTAPLLRSLSGRSVAVPGGSIAAHACEAGVVLSHFDEGRISLVDPGDGLRWERDTGAHPFGALTI